MYIEENWALFVEGNIVKWSFGNPDKEFTDIVVNFLVGLSQFGEEVFSEGVANINFNVKKRSGYKASELVIISLERKFFLVISDPLVSLKLIAERGGIPQEIEEIMRAVLVGQGAILYANTLTEAKNDNEKREVEKLFQDIILDINEEYGNSLSEIVSRSSSNFSMLSFKDILLFHYYLRKEKGVIKQKHPWALISDVSGGGLPFDYKVEEHKNPVVLAGYLAIFISFLQALFNSRPKSMVFGGYDISYLKFIHGIDYFLAISGNITDLCIEGEFFKELMDIEKEILDEITPNLKTLLVEEITSHYGEKLLKKELKALIEEEKKLKCDF